MQTPENPGHPGHNTVVLPSLASQGTTRVSQAGVLAFVTGIDHGIGKIVITVPGNAGLQGIQPRRNQPTRTQYRSASLPRRSGGHQSLPGRSPCLLHRHKSWYW